MHEGLRLRAHALLYIVDAFVQDLPDHPAKSMSDGPYGRLIAEPGQQSTEDGLEMGTPASGCRVSRLVEKTAHVLVAFC